MEENPKHFQPPNWNCEKKLSERCMKAATSVKLPLLQINSQASGDGPGVTVGQQSQESERVAGHRTE